MKSLRSLVWTGVAGVALSSTVLAQVCAIPCNGTQVNCSHQNGIRNHRGGPASPKAGPNSAAGNVLGDAEWKIWACENGGTRGSGTAIITNWEIGAVNNLPSQLTTATFDIPDVEFRAVDLTGNGGLGTAGVKEPDIINAPIAAFGVGTIALPTGGFRINVSVGQGIAAPASCTAPTGLPTITNQDVAMLFLYTPGEVDTSPTYYRNFQLTTEVNTISNPSVPPAPPGGNSYSGSVDALLGVVTHYAISSELYGEMGFYNPTLEVLRLTTGFTAATTGSGARELAAGDSLVFRSEDWQGGVAAIAGQNRLSAVLLSDSSGGNPLCVAPPGFGVGFLAGSLFLPGSTGVLALYPTGTTIAFIPTFSAVIGAGMNCHVVADVACSTTTGLPSIFTDMRAVTPALVIPPGLTGATFNAAAFSLNLTTFQLEDGSNTVELSML